MADRTPAAAHTGPEMVARTLPQAIAILMLLWGLYPRNPYGYYMLLRVVVCAVCAYVAVRAASLDRTGWAWVLGVAAVVYNPIIPVHLTRGPWSIVNALTVAILVGSVFALRGRRQ